MAIAVILSFLAVAYDIVAKNRNEKRIVLSILIILYAVFAATRSTDYPDTIPYRDFFTISCETPFFSANNTIYEIGFVYLTRFICLFTHNVNLYFFIIALLIYVVTAAAFKNNRFVIIPFVLFMSFYGMYLGFVILRAGLAIAFFSYAVLRCNRKVLKKIICFALAILCHRSAIVIVAAYLIALLFRKRKLNYKLALLLIVLFFLCYATGLTKTIMVAFYNYFVVRNNGSIIIIKIITYLEKYIETYSVGFSIRYFLNVIIFTLMLYTVKKNKIKETKAEHVLNYFILFGILVESIAGNTLIIGRVTDFFMVINLMSIVRIYYYSRPKPPKKAALLNNRESLILQKNTFVHFLLLCAYITMNFIMFYRFIGL